MNKDANPSVITVTNSDTWQKIADNQRKKRNYKDVSNVEHIAIGCRVPQPMKTRSSQQRDSDNEKQKGFVKGLE